MKKFIAVIVALGLFYSSKASAQSLTATVNRSELPQGETLLLTLETDDTSSNQAPDLNVLNKDFTVYSVGNAFQSTYVNGVSKHKRQWQIVMIPKNAGQVEIPSVSLGSLTSQPVILNVLPAQLSSGQNTSSPQTENSPRFAVEAEVDNDSPYVQQQINYTFTLYDTGGLQGEMPQFIDDGSGSWIIKSLGEPIVNSRVINGRQLREIQFKYALFPQKSGELKTPNIEFNGYYLTRSRNDLSDFEDVFNQGFFRVGFGDMFASRNPVVLTPEPVTVNVRPIPPTDKTGWWLPASRVELSSEWQPENPVFKAGEAVSRAVYIKAAGVTETQLPDVNFPEVKGMKQYPEKAISMSSQHKDEIISVKKLTNVYIPQQAGTFELPEISIDWFNIHTGKQEKAILPAQVINVQSGAVVEAAPAVLPAAVDTKTEPEKTVVSADPATTAAAYVVPAVAAFILGLGVSYLIFNRGESEPNAKEYTRRIVWAAKEKDFKLLRDNLIEWSRLVYNNQDVANLNDIAALSGDGFKEQLSLLNTMLYSGTNSEFIPEEFLAAFMIENKRKKKSPKSQSPLPGLYK